jgi:hypothetical protein
MALTLEAEQRLTSAGLVRLFDQHRNEWVAHAKETYGFLKERFPPGAAVRRDDVAKALNPIMEVNELLRKELARKKLRQKYWVCDFVDLIIEHTWDEISRADV